MIKLTEFDYLLLQIRRIFFYTPTFVFKVMHMLLAHYDQITSFLQARGTSEDQLNL